MESRSFVAKLLNGETTFLEGDWKDPAVPSGRWENLSPLAVCSIAVDSVPRHRSSTSLSGYHDRQAEYAFCVDTKQLKITVSPINVLTTWSKYSCYFKYSNNPTTMCNSNYPII